VTAEKIRFVPLVKAYPTPSERYGEAVCVAGVQLGRLAPNWVRIYPVLFRDLPAGQQFSKYDILELDVLPHSDYRPESHRPVLETMHRIGHFDTKDSWRERREIVEPILIESMCDLARRQELDQTSLGAFRPHEVTGVVPSPESGEWDGEQLASLSQISLFAQDRKLLRKVPWRFRYHYNCGARCRGHKQTIIDWEIYATYFNARRTHSEDDAVTAVCDRWLNTICGQDRDTIFFVGNQREAPKGFVVLGVFWPPKLRPSKQMEHLDLGF
jgi:hypothetical protein